MGAERLYEKERLKCQKRREKGKERERHRGPLKAKRCYIDSGQGGQDTYKRRRLDGEGERKWKE